MRSIRHQQHRDDDNRRENFHLEVFAHSLATASSWEPLEEHLQAVGEAAGCRARPFALETVAQAAGLLHDIGKASSEFQAYIRGQGPSPDHSTAGAIEATIAYPGLFGRALAFVIAGHHAGLADGSTLAERLTKGGLPAYDAWRRYAVPPNAAEFAACKTPIPNPNHPGFAEAFLMRMLFSCLVDGDFVETERFYALGNPSEPHANRETFAAIDILWERLNAYLARLPREPTPLNKLRSRVQAHTLGRNDLAPGLFTLTVPTGGGKTLTSFGFALKHARRYDLRRVIYVSPFTSIIEQTADIFRAALGEAVVLEHHASFDWEAALSRGGGVPAADGGQSDAGLARLRRAAENWDAPVVVTTAVQFFESLFADRTSRCRKLHNLAKAVIVLDEAQTLPLRLLRPCLAAMDELQRNYGSSVVLCTATQPAIRVQDGFKGGLDIPAARELAPDPPALYAALRRVAVERRAGVITDAEVADWFGKSPQMLAVVNSRRHARELFERIRAFPGAVHLSTLIDFAHDARSRFLRARLTDAILDVNRCLAEGQAA